MENPYLRDEVDVFIESSLGGLNDVTFVFLSTRKRLYLKISDRLLRTLPLMDGDNSIEHIQKASGSSMEELINFINYLKHHGIVVSKNWIDKIPFDKEYKSLLERQLYFLLDLLGSPESVFEIQKRIRDSRVAIVGIGAVGGWILVQLIQMGFEKFKIFDFKHVKQDSVSRHAFFDYASVGQEKVSFYSKVAREINPNIEIESYCLSLKTDRSFLENLDDVDLIINCADEPYIGYSSIFLSRYAIEKRKILFVSGGFDAHLGCLGELIVPFKTPCSDCYNNYFKKSLKDWKPFNHPVKDRIKGFGGLSSLSVFSASAACLTILRYFLDPKNVSNIAKGRGEFKFDDYSIDSFEVLRDQNCEVCGGQS